MNVQGAIVGLLALVLVISAGNDVDDPAKLQFEAAFQGMYFVEFSNFVLTFEMFEHYTFN